MELICIHLIMYIDNRKFYKLIKKINVKLFVSLLKYLKFDYWFCSQFCNFEFISFMRRIESNKFASLSSNLIFYLFFFYYYIFLDTSCILKYTVFCL